MMDSVAGLRNFNVWHNEDSLWVECEQPGCEWERELPNVVPVTWIVKSAESHHDEKHRAA